MKLNHVESNIGHPKNSWMQKQIIEPLNAWFATVFSSDGGGIFTGVNSYATSAAITATSSPLTQAGAVLLIAEFNNVTTSAITNAGVRLGDLGVGSKQVVKNNGNNAIKVYPFLGSKIDGIATNTAIVVPAGVEVVFYKINATVWESNIETVLAGLVITDRIIRKDDSFVNISDLFLFGGDGVYPVADNSMDVGSSIKSVRELFSNKISNRGSVTQEGEVSIGLLSRSCVVGVVDLSEGPNMSIDILENYKIIGCQLRVASNIQFSGGGATWSAAYNGGIIQQIAVAQNPSNNTVVDKFFDPNLDSPITTSGSYIEFSSNAGTITSGIVVAVVYYEYFTSLVVQ